MVRQNKAIKGYTIFNKETKISQYADDSTLLLDGSPQSFEACVHTVLEYAKYSGLAMNFDKTKVVCIGRCILPLPLSLVSMAYLRSIRKVLLCVLL